MIQPLEQTIRKIFDIGVIIKGIDGVLETIGGVLLVFISPDSINKILAKLTQYELAEDPQDKLTNLFLRISSVSVSSEKFAIFFLLAHGITKIVIVWGLLKNRLWAYPVGLAVFSAFWAYEVYRYFLGHSITLLLLAILDIFVIYLTWHEYSLRKKELI